MCRREDDEGSVDFEDEDSEGGGVAKGVKRRRGQGEGRAIEV